MIDGQQRLTTLQIVLAVFRDFAAQHSFTNLSGDAQEYLINSRREGSELLKLIPTQADREQFKQVLTLGSLELLNQYFPLVKKKGAKKFDKRPSMVEAYAFFYQQLTDFFAETTHLETCFSILLESFHVVVVDLDKTDDAQVIFETLNARGAPLSPADLIRNYVFLRVAQQSNNLDALYDQYWAAFDQPFWRDSVLQGRLKRPHSDVFMQYFLTAQRGADISVKHLYVESKYTSKP